MKWVNGLGPLLFVGVDDARPGKRKRKKGRGEERRGVKGVYRRERERA